MSTMGNLWEIANLSAIKKAPRREPLTVKKALWEVSEGPQAL